MRELEHVSNYEGPFVAHGNRKTLYLRKVLISSTSASLLSFLNKCSIFACRSWINNVKYQERWWNCYTTSMPFIFKTTQKFKWKYYQPLGLFLSSDWLQEVESLQNSVGRIKNTTNTGLTNITKYQGILKYKGSPTSGVLEYSLRVSLTHLWDRHRLSDITSLVGVRCAQDLNILETSRTGEQHILEGFSENTGYSQVNREHELQLLASILLF